MDLRFTLIFNYWHWTKCQSAILLFGSSIILIPLTAASKQDTNKPNTLPTLSSQEVKKYICLFSVLCVFGLIQDLLFCFYPPSEICTMCFGLIQYLLFCFYPPSEILAWNWEHLQGLQPVCSATATAIVKDRKVLGQILTVNLLKPFKFWKQKYQYDYRKQ